MSLRRPVESEVYFQGWPIPTMLRLCETLCHQTQTKCPWMSRYASTKTVWLQRRARWARWKANWEIAKSGTCSAWKHWSKSRETSWVTSKGTKIWSDSSICFSSQNYSKKIKQRQLKVRCVETLRPQLQKPIINQSKTSNLNKFEFNEWN